MTIELLSENNITSFVKLTTALWPDNNFDEELSYWQDTLHNKAHYCALAKYRDQYIGFTHISIRNDYVEGATAEKTAYLEAIFVTPEFRNKKVATSLLRAGETWVKSNGYRQLASDTELYNLSSQQFHNKLGFIETNKIFCYLKEL